MKKIVSTKKTIQFIILAIAVISLLSLWPFRIWTEQVVTSVAPATGTMTEVINEEKALLQTIVAQYDHMDTIRVYLGENSVGEKYYLRILDEQWQQVCEEKAVIDHANLPGFQDVLIDIDMEVGKMYYVILQGYKSEIFVGCEFVPLTDNPHLGTLYYNDSAMDGMSLVADYCYGLPLRKGKVAIFGGIIVLLAAILLLVVHVYFSKKEDKLITVEKAFKNTCNPIVAAGTVFCLAAILMGACGQYLLDNTVFFVSVLLLAGILLYGINHNRDGQKPIFTVDYLKTHMGDLIQSVAIAGAIGACCEYMSGLYDIHHAVAERKEMLWFALAVIAMFGWKEIWNLYNAVYLLAAGAYGYHYYRTNLSEEMDEAEVLVLKYTVWIAILLGMIVLRCIIGICKKKLAKPAYGYAGLLGVFFAMSIIFRNGRWWTVAMVVAFTLFYLSYGMWEHKERLLVNVARGVVIQFIISTGYCLLHRPYVTFRNARYTHNFHTVTITATYLTMVECVAIVILLAKLAKSRKLKDTWKELVFFGVVSSYMIFTMARTAFLAVGVMVVFALVILAAGKGKEKLINMGKNLGALILAVIVCLPVTFTVQRSVPALVSEPHLYEIEYSMYCPEDVMRGRRLSSHNYMRVGRFIDVFCEKIFNIPEGTFDIYGEIAAYEKKQELKKLEKGQTSGKITVLPEEEFKSDIPGVADASQLVVSADADYLPEGVPKEEDDYTNGRLDIFRSYYEQLNTTGHEQMGAVLANGEIATHAHNIYLQVAFDHGIYVGILFILVGLVTFIKASLYYFRKKETITYAALPVVITVTVATAGLVEWVFHISSPCGFLLLMVITPLLFKNEG